MIRRSKSESRNYEVVTASVRASICGMCANLCDLCSGVDIEAMRWVVWSDVVVMGVGAIVLARVVGSDMVGGGRLVVLLRGMVVLMMVAGGGDTHVGEVMGGSVCDQQLGVCNQLFGRL
ncbi:Hypothetical predicted protein [Olea europaea subsp. europaea]|uniref:Uncharacterized protein n=1 Tax=Olea europaea subsp. europaea TaxID=158383 RepID=A0A8S0Q627_OLEEU|nr:Hypothetical predicted protein [Olea europaea subsp. europaea]